MHFYYVKTKKGTYGFVLYFQVYTNNNNLRLDPAEEMLTQY